jgi:YD repeat-containing protein
MDEIKEYDDDGNLIYHRTSYGVEGWYEYDENNNCISVRTNREA